MKSMYIGSGDVAKLLMGTHTKGFQDLLRKFVSDEKPNYNAFASPIDALRTGAILEHRYFLTLPDNYYFQYLVVSKEMNVLKCSIDFALIDGGKIVDFDELKTCFITDFIEFQQYRDVDYDVYISYLKKNYTANYNQVQQQLYVTELDEANLVFLEVFNYEDEENLKRDIQSNEVIKFRIKRDEKVIEKIKERALFFQNIKNYFKTDNDDND